MQILFSTISNLAFSELAVAAKQVVEIYKRTPSVAKINFFLVLNIKIPSFIILLIVYIIIYIISICNSGSKMK